MVNNRDRTTYIGTTNEDEMCNFYIMYWVMGKKPMDQNTCFTRGPPTWSWGGWFGGGLKNIPDQEASTLLTFRTSKPPPSKHSGRRSLHPLNIPDIEASTLLTFRTSKPPPSKHSGRRSLHPLN